MIRVHLASSTNSTIFTNCCSVAILDYQAFCPQCRKEVYPGEDVTENSRRVSRWNMAYGRNTIQGVKP